MNTSVKTFFFFFFLIFMAQFLLHVDRLICVEHDKSVAFNICNSCCLWLLKLKEKTKKAFFFIFILPCLKYFSFTNSIWWVNKMSSYIVKYFFHLIFYYVCNIFVLILYIKNKQGVPSVCVCVCVVIFSLSLSSHCVFIYLFFFISTPCQSLFSVN